MSPELADSDAGVLAKLLELVAEAESHGRAARGSSSGSDCRGHDAFEISHTPDRGDEPFSRTRECVAPDDGRVCCAHPSGCMTIRSRTPTTIPDGSAMLCLATDGTTIIYAASTNA